MTRRGPSPPPKGKAPAKFVNPGRANGAPLSLAEVEAIRASYAALRSERGVEKALGFPRNTIRRYLHHGDPARGIRPLLEGMPPPAAPAPPDGPPVLPPELHAPPPLPRGVPTDDGQPPPPLPDVQVPPPPAPVAVQQVPARAPQQAPQQPVVAVPGVGAPLPPVPAADPAAVPQQGGDTVASVQHTVSIANAELARISRNTRALYDLRQRTLTRMVTDVSKRAKNGETPKMSRSEREMLMLLREARVRPIEMLALHRVEVGILGAKEGGDAASGAIDPTDETKTIEELQADLRGLLDERRNLLGDDDDPALTKHLPRTPAPTPGADD